MPDPIDLLYRVEHGLRLDLHLAEDPGSAPVVVYAHGGGFRAGHRGDNPARLAHLAKLGLNIASIDYRLAPEWRFPAPVDDVCAAVAFLRERGGKLGIATDSIGLIGASAGGTLAALAAVSGSTAPSERVQAVSAWFCATDLVESVRRTSLESRVSPVSYEANLLEDVEDPAALAAASPARADLADAPPFLLVHGDSDRLVPPSQALEMHLALTRANRSSTLIRLAGAGHEDPAFDEGPLPAMIAAWMRAQLLPAR